MWKKSKKILLLSVLLSLTVSCTEKGGGDQSSPVTTIEPTSLNPFGATVGGSIQNFSVGEITRGEFGILLTEVSSDQSQDQSIFLDWKNAGSADGLKILRTSSLKDGTGFSVEFKDLVPGHSYQACAFFTDKNDNRMIGQIVRFTVPAAEYRVVTERVESPGYINAVLPGTVKTNLPTDKLNFGMIWSDTPGHTTLDSGHVVSVRKISGDDGRYSVDVTYFHASTTYYYRSYVSYEGEYIYGEEQSFTTRNADEMAVDLGLSVLWADCNLGATSWDEEGLALAWGELTEHGNGSKADYIYYVEGKYVDIGNEISGTEYDAAHVYLGGKWRMPTRDELYELLKYCSCGKVDPNVSVENSIILIKAANGKSIQFRSNRCYGYIQSGDNNRHVNGKSFNLTTGTLLSIDDPIISGSILYLEEAAMKSHYWFGNINNVAVLGFDKNCISSFPRNMCVPIRPVRDRD